MEKRNSMKKLTKLTTILILLLIPLNTFAETMMVPEPAMVEPIKPFDGCLPSDDSCKSKYESTHKKEIEQYKNDLLFYNKETEKLKKLNSDAFRIYNKKPIRFRFMMPRHTSDKYTIYNGLGKYKCNSINSANDTSTAGFNMVMYIKNKKMRLEIRTGGVVALAYIINDGKGYTYDSFGHTYGTDSISNPFKKMTLREIKDDLTSKKTESYDCNWKDTPDSFYVPDKELKWVEVKLS